MGDNLNLKPCPFCGSEKLKIEAKGADVSCRSVRKMTVSVRCNRCFARGGTAGGEVPDLLFGDPVGDKLTTFADLKERAAEKWNRRIWDG